MAPGASAAPRVVKLDDDLVNQIAAGEVVERPASVVKELVENALDAGATRVVVDVEQGGVTLVRVSDDGEGMSREDAALAVERHATSKIHALEDLMRLGTFGFRGEALPSIASVSRFELRTRRREVSEGTSVCVDGGGAARVAPAGGAPGTTVEVRDLFFNVPARRKFLKATGTESAHVGEVVLAAALARHDVTFVLSRDGRVVREYLRADSALDRARAALGEGASLVPCSFERGDLSVEALLGPPERARAGSVGLSLLVNGRPVKDRQLARAVAQAYGSVLEPGRYPVGVVLVTMPGDQVDVNVHPQKAEVRFSDARALFDAVTRGLHARLASAFALPALGAPGRPWFAGRSDAPPASAPPSSGFMGVLAGAATDALASPGEPPRLLAEGVTPSLFGERSLYGELRYVGQARATFLVCEGPDALYVLDQHAAAERVTFDRLRKAFAAQGIASQRLLVAEIVDLDARDAALLEEHAEEILGLGVEVRRMGERAVAVHALPQAIAKGDARRIVTDLAAELGREAGRPFAGAVDLVLATMACHGSVRAGDALSREQAEALLRALDEVDFSGHCPHGRPVVLRWSWGELERKLGR
ncbi:MAG: DNA mismatch repair endonuclease MutL [Myxococcales bacterium]|nr:DNA mismatch repair endonuclease MutL [Myxococcales bacterium]